MCGILHEKLKQIKFRRGGLSGSFGFTLVEMVIYAAILAVISVLVVNTILMMVRSIGFFRSVRDINSSAEISMERMVREVRLAASIDVADSVLGSSPGRLTLNTIDLVTEIPQKITFLIDSGKISLQYDGEAVRALTSDAVTVSRLVFTEIANSTSTPAVRVEMSFQAGGGAYQKSDNFYGTAVLRRSY
ncbi:MAG: hypothetical protein AAB378_02905 [Patescibacteria group bacterium]